MTLPLWRAATLSAASVLAGCLDGPAVGPAIPGGGQVGPGESFASIEAALLVPRCATSACHTGSPPASVPVSLDPGLAWVEMVGVQATQAPMAVVEPGDPAASYLLYKLRGTASDAGGAGTIMPPSDEPLTEDEIRAIESWIANGAQND